MLDGYKNDGLGALSLGTGKTANKAGKLFFCTCPQNGPKLPTWLLALLATFRSVDYRTNCAAIQSRLLLVSILLADEDLANGYEAKYVVVVEPSRIGCL
jgi:hypothetical protein